MSMLPQYVTREFILKRLPEIFPEGTPNRSYCTRGNAASAIFVMLYIGAVEGNDQYLAPVHIYRMTDEQAEMKVAEDRIEYASLKSKDKILGKRWYADNTREPIRDETLKDGLRRVGAVLEIPVPTTSSKPRYYLQKEFAELFDPKLKVENLKIAIDNWQKKYLSSEALTRVTLASLSAKKSKDKILITFPNGETRNLAPGPSSVITKEVIESFSIKFLIEPVVLWVSESGNKVVLRDDKLAKSIGINISQDKNLPDIILVDLGKDTPSLVFIEVVATDGPVTEARKNSIYELTDAAKFDRGSVFFVSAFGDRESAGSKKSLYKLAWNSFAWFASEPEKIMIMKEGMKHLSDIQKLFSD